MNLLAETTPEALFAEARRWNSLYAAPLAGRILPHANNPDLERRLKVGYVSPDLYGHAIMKFLPPVFKHHDRSRFEVFAYSVGSISDGRTDRLRESAENFICLPGSASDLAERIRADGIDILVDLAGHTMGSTYLAFAEKPAPVQVSWLGVLSTTGLDTMDYFLGDDLMPRRGTDHLFSEQVCRLPRISRCYRPHDAPPIALTPCLTRGYITFGSFNNPGKITRDVVKLWSAILHLVPRSRLLLKYKDFDAEPVQVWFQQWFAEDGIAPERVTFSGGSGHADYMPAFGDIDIALDPFPYNGATTTLDTLWMGLPVVSLSGRLPVQCAGISLLTAIGLPDLPRTRPRDISGLPFPSLRLLHKFRIFSAEFGKP